MARIRRFVEIVVACAISGALIGAADGAATVLSTVLYRDSAYVGAERLSAIALWAVGASAVGLIVGALIGVPVVYGIFGGRVSAREFMNVAAISLIGGVGVCLATGHFAMELSWLATPLITIVASLLLNSRRTTQQLNGGTS